MNYLRFDIIHREIVRIDAMKNEVIRLLEIENKKGKSTFGAKHVYQEQLSALSEMEVLLNDLLKRNNKSMLRVFSKKP